jgi:hypothetical protein
MWPAPAEGSLIRRREFPAVQDAGRLGPPVEPLETLWSPIA